MRKAWAVRFNSDQTEGRGPMVTTAHFDTEKLANEFLSQHTIPYGQKNWQGWADIVPIEIFNSIKEFETDSVEKIKRNALAKLSVEERKALGL